MYHFIVNPASRSGKGERLWKETIKPILEKKNVPQIVITDKENAPVTASATEVLVCDNHDLYFYNSVLAFFSMANALTYFSAMHDLEETTRLRSELAEAREAIGYVGTVN